MRRIISLNSVKAFYLDRNKLIKELQKTAREAITALKDEACDYRELQKGSVLLA